MDADAGPSDASATDTASYDIQPLPGPSASQWVRPLIGTSGPGNVFLGATLPHAMLKLGPDTAGEPGTIKSYSWDDKRIQAFSHTHLDGPGGSGYGYNQIALLPTMGTLSLDEDVYAAPFRHDDEVASPGWYGVTLTDHGIRAELTATAHCGWHRYQFPAGTARVLVDLGHTRGDSRGGEIHVQPAQVTGTGIYGVHPLLNGLLEGWGPPTGMATVHFHAAFNRQADRTGTWRQKKATPGQDVAGANAGAWLEFDSPTAQAIEVRVCLSLLSKDVAAKHLQNETAGKTWESTRDAAIAAWDALLGRVRVDGGSTRDLVRFYTALYHSLLQPADYTEDGWFWNGSANPPAAQATGGHRFFTDDWCIWDTARTTHPLLTLIEPEVVGDMVQSLLWLYQTGGWLPKCTWHATGDSRVMTGNFNFCVIADAWTKGLRDFDASVALAAMEKGAMQDSDNPMAAGFCGYLGQGTPPFYVDHGWVPNECDHTQAASMTMEHAYSDWCLAQFAGTQVAKTPANDKLAETMRKRGDNWRNVWNPAHAFPQLRRADGSWVEPFDAKALDGFTEANAWIYRWFVPQDRCGLIAAMGGRAVFVQQLDAFFADKHFDMSNEPDFHAPWLFTDAGRPDRTDTVVRGLLAKHFGDDPAGLPGNDDAGATSAWFVFAALGLYPVAPGESVYSLNSPLFPQAALRVGAATVTIEAPGVSDAKPYVQSATWNGKALASARILHADLAAGGTLHLTMGAQPSTWATADNCPP